MTLFHLIISLLLVTATVNAFRFHFKKSRIITQNIRDLAPTITSKTITLYGQKDSTDEKPTGNNPFEAVASAGLAGVLAIGKYVFLLLELYRCV